MIDAITTDDFFTAVQNLDKNTVAQYLSMGGNANAIDSGGFTALHILAGYAASDNEIRELAIDIITLLIDYSGDLTYADQWEVTPIYLAVSSGFIELVDIIKEKNIQLKDHISLHEFLFYKWPRMPSLYTRKSFPKILKLMLDEELDLEKTSDEHGGLTPLQIAHKEGSQTAIRLLLEAGAKAT